MAQSNIDASTLCCANFYEKDWVSLLLGESFHPGGRELSQSVVDQLGDLTDLQVLDIAAGLGTSARMMAQKGAEVTAMDISETILEKARNAHPKDIKSIRYQTGNVEALPYEARSFDRVLCECAFSTFPNQPAAAAEICRVLKPGGIFTMTDMCVQGPLPEKVSAAIAPWTCLEHAGRVEDYQQVFLEAGLRVLCYQDESHHLLSMLSMLKRNLLAAGMGQMTGYLGEINLTLRDARDLLREGETLVKEGKIQYARILFSKRTPTSEYFENNPPSHTNCEPGSGCC